jgi:hypothetical protein
MSYQIGEKGRRPLRRRPLQSAPSNEKVNFVLLLWIVGAAADADADGSLTVVLLGALMLMRAGDAGAGGAAEAGADGDGRMESAKL